MFFLTSLSGLIGARFLYVITHFSDFGVNPFRLFLFTHFPGLSFWGAVLGGTMLLFWFLKKKTMLRARIFDLAILSFLPAVILGYLGDKQFLLALLFIAVFILLVRIYRAPSTWTINFPGVFFLIFLIVFSISQFVLDFAKDDRTLVKLVSVEQIISIVVFLFTLYFLARGLRQGHL